MKDNLVLIGMPGSGKSTCGVLLAKALGKRFLDLDLEIIRRTGKRLQEILDHEGLEPFLRAEAAAALALDCTNTVIATGGSVVLEPDAMEYLRRTGTVVFLDVPLPELQRRITNIRSRGIAFAPGQVLDDIYTQRMPLYRQYADLTIAAEPDMEASVEAILTALR